MENPNFTKMSPDYKKRFREMIEKDRKEKEKKKQEKMQKEANKKAQKAAQKASENQRKKTQTTRREEIADKLYGGNK